MVRILAGLGVTANQVTIAACLFSVLYGVLLLIGNDPRLFLALPAVLFLRMALNAMDGMLAREFAQASRLGVFLNELADVVSDMFLYLPFAHVHGFSPFWIWNVVVLALMTEMTGTVAVMAGSTRRYDGPMGKSDRAVVFGALGLWIGLTGGAPAAFANWFPKVMAVLLILTAVNRVRGALRGAAVSIDEEGEYACVRRIDL